MFLQLLYLIFCLYVIYECRRRSKRSVPSPPKLSGSIPFIGHSFKFLGDRKHALEIVKEISKESLKQGGVIKIQIANVEYYAVADPEDCSVVSNSCLDKDYYYSFAKPFLGNGLTIANVPIWRQHRKLINPSFRQQILNSFLTVFNYQARRLVTQLSEELGKGSFNHERYIRLNNLESICMTAFGADIADFGGLHKQYLEGVNDILDIFTERFQKIWLHNNFFYKMSGLKKRQDTVVRRITDFTNAMLQKKKKEMIENHNSNSAEEFTPFMNLLLKLAAETGSFSDKDIQDETNAIVGGGYDTTACTLILALMLIGSHPKSQQTIYEELQTVFGSSDRDVDKEDLLKMVYLEAVIKETLRLYPIAPILARYISSDVQLKHYNMQAGHGVLMMIWGLHRHPVWGADAEEYKPERWLSPDTLPKNPNTYAAFSLGRRSCIGKTYAMMSMKTVLSHIIRNYKISSDMSKLELELDTILRISSGQNITIVKRNKSKIK